MDRVDNAWSFLEDSELFTIDELRLVTDLNGYTLNTLNDACEARYAEDLEQLGFEDE